MSLISSNNQQPGDIPNPINDSLLKKIESKKDLDELKDKFKNKELPTLPTKKIIETIEDSTKSVENSKIESKVEIQSSSKGKDLATKKLGIKNYSSEKLKELEDSFKKKTLPALPTKKLIKTIEDSMKSEGSSQIQNIKKNYSQEELKGDSIKNLFKDKKLPSLPIKEILGEKQEEKIEHSEIKNKLASLQNLVTQVKENKNLKMKVVVNKETGNEDLGIKKRGLFKVKAGSSEATNRLINHLLPKLKNDVLATGDKELMGTFKKQLSELKNSPWGTDICHNNPEIKQTLDGLIKDVETQQMELYKTFAGTLSRNEAIKYRDECEGKLANESLTASDKSDLRAIRDLYQKQASKFSEEELANMLLGIDKDKSMSQSVLDMAGWGVLSPEQFEKGFMLAIGNLEKEEATQIDNEIKNLISSATQLLEKKPPIKNLRNQDTNINFYENVLKKLDQLDSTKCGGKHKDEIQKMMTLYKNPPSIEVKEVKSKSTQGAAAFLEKMEGVRSGTISKADREAMLNGMTQDLRTVCSTTISQIEPGEFDGLGWSKTEKEKTSPNIVLSTRTSTELTDKFADLILDNCKTPTEAKNQLEFFCDLADRLVKDKNYDALFALNGALGSAPIYRLLKGLGGNLLEKYENAVKITTTSNNSGAYRRALIDDKEKFLKKESSLPPIPYLGTLLTDLTFLNDGNKNKIDDQINGNKIIMLKKSTEDFQSLQKNLKDRDNPVHQTGFMEVPPKVRKNEKGEKFTEKELNRERDNNSLKILPRSSG